MNIENVYNLCLSLPNVVEDAPFGEEYLTMKVYDKIFMLCSLERFPFQINLKCEPELAILLREKYEDNIIAGYHMNKKHWNTIFPENLPEDLVKKMIIHSYEAILEKFPLKIRKNINYKFQKPLKTLDIF